MNINNMVPYIRYSVERKCSAGWFINTRSIPDHEFVLITGGSGFVTIEGKTSQAMRGKLFYFYPGLLHSMKSMDEDPLEFLAIHYSYAYIGYSNDDWSIKPGDDVLPIKTVSDINSHLKVSTLMSEINKKRAVNNPDNDLYIRALFMQMLHTIILETQSRSINYSNLKRVEKVIRYIQNNTKSTLAVKDLAKLACISPDYLSSIFKSYTGYPIVTYINRQKINIAKNILMEKQLKVKDVALLSGFKDEFYFSRLFKKFEGISPSEFLKRITDQTTTPIN